VTPTVGETPKGRFGSFLSWLLLRAAVNTAELTWIGEMLRRERVERWAARSYEHEAVWRRR
jgi:hypothetical protein